ncbi:unnamed protein product [Allacma fusca]|uniref:CNH domain-containing protein n=1 Tax=Allacma fusca TaxID=39272 RepID=A0A8J2JJC8_9HEXA|nr:unnamed protein product [Allacma fusca]
MSFFLGNSSSSSSSQSTSRSPTSSFNNTVSFNNKSTAYECRVVLSGLPLVIESLCGYDNNLLVGTKEGHLLIYKVIIETGLTPPIPVDVHITHSNKHFSKKPIIQLDVIPEHKVLISLTADNGISVHDMALYTCPSIATIEKTKGATLFSLDIQRQLTLTLNPVVTVRMCVVVGKRLQLFYWKNRSFYDLRDDLYVPDIPRAITWCKETLCLGLKNEYVTVSVQTGEQKEVCSTGRQGDAIIAKISEDTIAVVQEKSSVLKKIGDPTPPTLITWSEIPSSIVYDEPYMLAVYAGKSVEIQTITPKLKIDSFQLPTTTAKLMTCSNRGTVYIASVDNVWCLKSTPVDTQIDAFLKQQQFELALSLANIYDIPEKDRNVMINRIQMQHAFFLFCQKKFEESLTIFQKLGTDVPQVIGLFPNLLPPEYQQKMVYSGKLPELEGSDLEKGLAALQVFLTHMRVTFVRNNTNQTVTDSASMVEGAAPMVNKRKVLQIIDTTLLKCYLKTNESLVASLLRLKENYCHPDETERILKHHNKIEELIIFYRSKEDHRKALSLLQRHNNMRGTIDYLQNLSFEHIEVILDFSKSVLHSNPEEGLKIFTEDYPEVEALPRPRIYDFLDRNFKHLVIPYLRHVIFNWKEKNSLFHNALVHQYRERATTDNDPSAAAEARVLLREFLKNSKFYTPENVLALFPYNDMFEERALILERLGRHDQALSIYVTILKDRKKAFDYCKRVYKKNDRDRKEVYTILMRMLLNPPTSLMPGIALEASEQSIEPDLVGAVQLLHDFAPYIEPSRALLCLPDDVEVKQIENFLKTSVQNHSAEKRKLLIMKGLAEAEYKKANADKAMCESERFAVPDTSICAVCGKRIANQRIFSAFARFPDGSIVHYMCQQQAYSDEMDRSLKNFFTKAFLLDVSMSSLVKKLLSTQTTFINYNCFILNNNNIF